MGWTSLRMNGRKPDVEFFSRQFRPMAIHDLHDNHGTIYLVVSNQSDPSTRFAVVVLTEWRGDEMAYKEMSEHMGPYYYDCPERLLDQLTNDGYASIGCQTRTIQEWLNYEFSVDCEVSDRDEFGRMQDLLRPLFLAYLPQEPSA